MQLVQGDEVNQQLFLIGEKSVRALAQNQYLGIGHWVGHCISRFSSLVTIWLLKTQLYYDIAYISLGFFHSSFHKKKRDNILEISPAISSWRAGLPRAFLSQYSPTAGLFREPLTSSWPCMVEKRFTLLS